MIVFIIDYIERFNFYSRMFTSLSGEYKVVVVTHDPIVYLLCRKFPCKCILIKKNILPIYLSDSDADRDIITSIEVLNDDFSYEQAKNSYISTVHTLESLFKNNRIIKCVIWNGETLIGRATTQVCRKLSIEKIYLEISNLPNKMFSDPMGANAKSSIFYEPSIIDNLPLVSEQQHQAWIKLYEDLKAGKLPQAQSKFFRRITGAINYGLKYLYASVYKKSFNRFKIKSQPNMANIIFNNAFDIKNEEYIFLPLQVSTDTQIKLNSNYNNIDAIRFALHKANQMNIKLLVKIHPAEKEQVSINNIIQEQKITKFILTNINTIDLIKNSTEVVVINSTVGLESLIYGKKVTVIGNALYLNFDQTKLKKYIHSYLIDGVDYFSNGSISLENSLKLLKI